LSPTRLRRGKYGGHLNQVGCDHLSPGWRWGFCKSPQKAFDGKKSPPDLKPWAEKVPIVGRGIKTAEWWSQKRDHTGRTERKINLIPGR